MYTKESIRSRLKLRNHPDVLRALARWWAACPKSGSGKTVSKEAYLQMNAAIQLALVADAAEADWDEAEVRGKTRARPSHSTLARGRPP